MRSSTPSCQSPPHRMAPLPTSKKTSLLTVGQCPIWALPGVMERMARLPVSRKDTSWVPAKTTSASDTNARLSRLVAADHSQAHEHGWTELLTISLGRHAEFARSSRSRTSTTSATNRAGRSGKSVHVCAPRFEDPTVSISHPTESLPRNNRRPAPCNAPATSDMGSIAMYVTPGFPCRLGARQISCPRARITHCCRFRSTGGTPGMRSAGYPASADQLCLVILSRLRVRAPRAARYTRHALPHKFDLEINRRRYVPRTVGKSRACQAVPTVPGPGSSERGVSQ